MSDSPSYAQYAADQLVREVEKTIYDSPGDQALFMVHQVYCLGYRWEEIYSYVNSTNKVYKKDVEYTVETKVTTSNTDEISASIGLQLEGVSVDIGGSHTTITEKEITSTSKESESIEVDPGTSVYFYRKVFSFRIRTWFINDAWGYRWRVGGYGSYTPCSVENTVDYEVRAYYRSPSELKGTTSISVSGIDSEVTFHATRKFENCTERCQNSIISMGVPPPRVIRMAQVETPASADDQTGHVETAARAGKGKCHYIWGDGRKCSCKKWVDDRNHPDICGYCGHTSSYHK